MISNRHGRAPRRHPTALLGLAGLALALASPPSFASLGAAPSTFANATDARQARLLAANRGAGTSGAACAVNVATLPGGTVVREYVADGVVFAVSWKGPFLPDLRTLLGRHFATLTAEASAHAKAGRAQLHIARPDVTIESTGHMRAHAGRAWVASLLPAGFDTDDIE